MSRVALQQRDDGTLEVRVDGHLLDKVAEVTVHYIVAGHPPKVSLVLWTDAFEMNGPPNGAAPTPGPLIRQEYEGG